MEYSAQLTSEPFVNAERAAQFLDMPPQIAAGACQARKAARARNPGTGTQKSWCFRISELDRWMRIEVTSGSRPRASISEQPVPLDMTVLEDLQSWKNVCGYPEPSDWVFASHHHFGKTPLWPDSLRTKIL